jgi:hypothetical protein
VHGWLEALPDLLAAADFRAVVAAIRRAQSEDRGIVWGLGAHVIKTGLGPVLIDLMERGFVSALAMNGAGLIHDFEVALSGSTSEEVDAVLGLGQSAWPRKPGASSTVRSPKAIVKGRGLGSPCARISPAHVRTSAGCRSSAPPRG